MNVQKLMYYGFVAPIILAIAILAVKPFVIEDPKKRCISENGIWLKVDYSMVCVKSKYRIFSDKHTD